MICRDRQTFNLSAGFEYGFTVTRDMMGFARIDYAYVGEYHNRTGESTEATGWRVRPGSTQEPALLMNNVDLDLFVNNLDQRRRPNVGRGSQQSLHSGSNRAYRLRPRVIGFNIGYRF